MTSSQSEPRFESTDQERRSIFVGRVQEQRQFQVALQGLLAHHRRWCELADKIGLDFDPEVAPGRDLLLERMQREEELTTDEVLLFRDPLAANAAKLVQGMKQVAQQRPMVIETC
jgi:hypothetical protein